MNKVLSILMRLAACICFVIMCHDSTFCSPSTVGVDTCMVTGKVRFSKFPVPGDATIGSLAALQHCPSVNKKVAKLPNARVGKARNVSMELYIVDGKLIRMQATCSGEKDFSRFYKQLIDQIGVPSKMVESNGISSFSWEFRSKLKAKIDFRFIPETQSAKLVFSL